MQDEVTVLRAVIENPNADGPRLAYATWCEQQSDPPRKARARFIRAQVEYATLDRVANPRRKYNLGQEWLELERAGRGVWDRNIFPLVRKAGYHRGFIELVEMSAEDFLSRGRDLRALAPVCHLDLANVRPVLRDLLASPLLDGIRSLSLIECDLDDADIAALATSPHLTQLRWLSLAHNGIGEGGVESIATSKMLPSLAWVNLAGNRIEPNEEYSFDNGFVVDAGLPEIGRLLELRLGRLPWLRHAATTLEDQVPDRFRLAPAAVVA